MIKVQIDGKEIEVPQGSTIIEAADDNGISIPRFCYHKKLSIAANCRMCLVEVEKAPKPLPACATPLADGMKVWTKSPKAVAAQKGVMEFLLINHPLDCPICDQGGECELQDLSMGYGASTSRFNEAKIVVKDKNIGPLISTDMTRCILCTRCVRFGEEIAGIRELGDVGRGPFSEITTFVEKSVDSEVSGNIIDLCPVGALNNKPFRFKARGWEMKAFPSIAPHDCLGSNINIHSRRGDILRVVPRENESVNEVWISDRDRFSLEANYHENRLLTPIYKKDGKWEKISWENALEIAVSKLGIILDKHGANKIGALVSPNTTLEEQYLIQKILRAIGSDNIDHRLRQIDFEIENSMPAFPNLGLKISELENQDGILLIGSDLHKEQPIAGVKLRKMVQKGGEVFVVNPADFKFNFEVTAKSVIRPQLMIKSLLGIAKAIFNKTKKSIKDFDIEKLLKNIVPSEVEEKIANKLLNKEKRFILVGSLASYQFNYSQIITLANLISKLLQAQLGVFTDGANAGGAWLTGCIPNRDNSGKNLETKGLNAKEMLTSDELKAHLLFNVEPGMDDSYGNKTFETLINSEFVLAFSAFKTDRLDETADMILPIATYAETSGNYVNIAGDCQMVIGAGKTVGESRPLWKILRVLGNLFDLDGFEYESSEDVLKEIKNKIGFEHQLDKWELDNKTLESLRIDEEINSSELNLISQIPLYKTDILVRHSKPLQETYDAKAQTFARINKTTASSLQINDNDMIKVISNNTYAILPVKIDGVVPEYAVIIPQCLESTAGMDFSVALVAIERA